MNDLFLVGNLSCPLLLEPNSHSFSLLDYRNNYFTSNDPNKITEFYNSFEDRNQLIRWMIERPTGVNTIYEVEGNKDVIVVIPTADYNGKFARNCRENIFAGLHIIFVESGLKEEFYFNYARNCNKGVKKAMQYEPKWIVISNDDMEKQDDIKVLTEQLKTINNNDRELVYAKPSLYHSYNSSIGETKVILTFLGLLIHNLIKGSVRVFLEQQKILKSYSARTLLGPRNKVLAKIFLKNPRFFRMTSTFTILSGLFCKSKEGSVFNEVYINGVEDWELSLSLSTKSENLCVINYRIKDLVGETLGTGLQRRMRGIINQIYFDERNGQI